MKLLAIETAGAACSIALEMDGECSLVHEVAPMQQAQHILPFLAALLKPRNIHIHQLDAIAFGCGPGSFTGVRLAASITQGLAFAHAIPVIPISSLAALAQTVYEAEGWEDILVAVDARRNEVYWGAYQKSPIGTMSLVGKETLCAPKNCLAPEGEEWRGAGNGWQAYSAILPAQLKAIDTGRMASAKAVLSLAKPKFQQGDYHSPHQAWPIYLRNDVAQMP